MTPTHLNLVLIGMPGSGKSTVGVILAKKTARNFVDTDLLIQTSQNRTLQDIVDMNGQAALRKIEEDILCGLSVQNSVIATGGSAVYSERAMTHLKSNGILIFLNADLDILESRVHDFNTRGLARQPDQSLAGLYNERYALYAKYADITIMCNDRTPVQICESIIDEVRERN